MSLRTRVSVALAIGLFVGLVVGLTFWFLVVALWSADAPPDELLLAEGAKAASTTLVIDLIVGGHS